MTRWLRPTLIVLVTIAAVALFSPVFRVAAVIREDLALDHVVRAVALDWRDFGRRVALDRLRIAVDRGEVGTHVTDTACGLRDGADGAREVVCAWGVVIDHPLVDWQIPLSFRSYAVIDKNGDLDW